MRFEDIPGKHRALMRTSAIYFSEKVLDLRCWKQPRRVMNAISKHKEVAWRSGHKVSKSTTAAAVALWWVVTKPRGVVAMTSASYLQVRKILWKEVAKRYRQSKIPLGGTLYRDPNTGLVFPDGREIFGFTTAEVERAAGISSDQVLYIIDEASGESIDNVMEAIEGNLAGGGSLLLTGNPTRTSGYFWGVFHGREGANWKLFHTPSTLSPNVTGKEPSIPGLATKEWIEERRAKWGEGSAAFRVRVMGDFPEEGDNVVFGLALVTDAQLRTHLDDEGMLTLGVDPARYGDDETVIIARRHKVLYPPKAYKNLSGPAIVARACEEIEARRRPGETKVKVRVDEIGLGATVIDSFGGSDRARRLGVEVVPVNVGEKATDSSLYSNKRAECAFVFRDWIKEGGALPEDEVLEEELLSLTYDFDGKGRYRLPSKDKERKNLGRSPDRRDAAMLAVYDLQSLYTIGSAFIAI